MRILIVEDEIDLLEAISEGLTMDGYAVDTCENGLDAYELAFVENYDIMILDLNIPGMDGLEVLQKIRREKSELKILILSARSSVSDKVAGLDLGANDYLAKPFAFAELEARIRNLLKQKFIQVNNRVSCGRITIDLSKRIASIDTTNLLLTKKEFSLLEYFILNKERIISQEELIDHVWNEDSDSFSSAIRVHIATLRKKLKIYLQQDPIHTKIGYGYYMSEKGGEL